MLLFFYKQGAFSLHLQVLKIELLIIKPNTNG